MRIAMGGMVLAVAAGCATAPDAMRGDRMAAGGVNACQAVSEADVASWFERWNRSLQSGDPQQVVANYDARSMLLPTLSGKPRISAAEKADYFKHFLEDRPSGRIETRHISLGCNMAVDTGVYTFNFARTGAVAKARYSYTYRWDGKQWLIVSHHSSLQPN